MLNLIRNKMIDFSKIESVELDGVCVKDYPDFVDAFVTSGVYDGREMTEEEMDFISDDYDFMYNKIINLHI